MSLYTERSDIKSLASDDQVEEYDQYLEKQSNSSTTLEQIDEEEKPIEYDIVSATQPYNARHRMLEIYATEPGYDEQGKLRDRALLERITMRRDGGMQEEGEEAETEPRPVRTFIFPPSNAQGDEQAILLHFLYDKRRYSPRPDQWPLNEGAQTCYLNGSRSFFENLARMKLIFNPRQYKKGIVWKRQRREPLFRLCGTRNQNPPLEVADTTRTTEWQDVRCGWRVVHWRLSQGSDVEWGKCMFTCHTEDGSRLCELDVRMDMATLELPKDEKDKSGFALSDGKGMSVGTFKVFALASAADDVEKMLFHGLTLTQKVRIRMAEDARR